MSAEERICLEGMRRSKTRRIAGGESEKIKSRQRVDNVHNLFSLCVFTQRSCVCEREEEELECVCVWKKHILSEHGMWNRMNRIIRARESHNGTKTTITLQNHGEPCIA